ncbi:uncharacterized protein BDW70DRAFT_147018 [Aspergillus foveolatus]|uniref:uncharacterized protein n=1 Tax=Aspergillus foveolatus TaxID=210207 RepID=UPI003CCCAB6C
MRKDLSLETTELTTLRQDGELLSPASGSYHDPDADRTCAGILGFGGWKATLYLGSATSFTVLILNLVMVCWASFRHSDQDQSVLYSGDCDRVKELGTCVHLLINVLSTLLLSASNFGMQCLSAPTRKDIDRAHANNEWLDIGVHSIRNLRRIPRFRMLLWLSLVLTSVPLHLFYNSTVYSTLSANAYDVYIGNSSFTSLTPADVANVYDPGWNATEHYASAPRLVRMAAELERLSPEDCISTYETTFMSKYASVVLISDTFNGSTNVPAADAAVIYVDTARVLGAGEYTDTVPYNWICDDKLDQLHYDHNCADRVRNVKSSDEWVVGGYKIDYCLAERTAEKCTLEYSLPLAIVVICVNFVKALLICLAPSLLGDGPLLTIGDGIGSFLRWPDETTEGNCLLTREIPDESEIKPLRYSAMPKRRWTSLSRARWVTCLLTYMASIAVCIGLLSRGIATMGSTEGVWTSGLAAVSTKTMIESLYWPRGLIPNVLIANIPQLIYSGLYFMSNSILTNMALSCEWANFSFHRKGLRVSSKPRGHQRRTHFLSLPLRFGVPLILVSALLHWLMSQSLYLVRIIAYTGLQTRNADYDTMTLGYSPPAIVIGLCVGMLLPAGLVLFGCGRFQSGMPVAGSCSMAIAAACHPKGQTEEDRANLEYQRLKWGVEAYQKGEVWHCAFSDGKVMKPEDGTEYQ